MDLTSLAGKDAPRAAKRRDRGGKRTVRFWTTTQQSGYSCVSTLVQLLERSEAALANCTEHVHRKRSVIQ